MTKTTTIQLGILSLIIIILVFFYNFYFKDRSLQKSLKNKENKLTSEYLSNKIIELKYITSDKDNNTYKILADSGEISEKNENLLRLKDVRAEIYINNTGTVYIHSSFAKYNKKSLDTHFYNNVHLIYDDHNINSDDIFLTYSDKEIKIKNNVVYQSNTAKLNADIVEIDLITKISKLYMMEDNKKIKGQIKN